MPGGQGGPESFQKPNVSKEVCKDGSARKGLAAQSLGPELGASAPMCSTWEWWHAVVPSALRKQSCRVSAAPRLLPSCSDGVWDGHPTLTFSLNAYMCVLHTGRWVLPSERFLSFMCHKIDKQLTVKQILIPGVQNGVWETRFLTCFQILYVLLCTRAL